MWLEVWHDKSLTSSSIAFMLFRGMGSPCFLPSCLEEGSNLSGHFWLALGKRGLVCVVCGVSSFTWLSWGALFRRGASGKTWGMPLVGWGGALCVVDAWVTAVSPVLCTDCCSI